MTSNRLRLWILSENEAEALVLSTALQRNSRAPRIQTRQRNRQATLDIALAQHCAFGGFLQTLHVAIGNDVRLQLRKTQEHIRVAKADSDHRRLALNQLLQC